MNERQNITSERPCVRWRDTAQEEPARALAHRLGLEPCPRSDAADGLELSVTSAGLELRAVGPGAPRKGLRVSFLEPGLLRRAVRAGARTETLVRAVGARRGHRPAVLDATAGLGRDAFILAAAGCRVTMAERNPVLAAMLDEAVAEAVRDRRTHAVAQRLKLLAADAAEVLRRGARPDVVYLDPMFPAREKSAAVKKEMQLLQRLLGPADDGESLLAAALEHAESRVVVKRPLHAEPLAGHAPDVSYEGRSTRFDAYMVGR